MKCVYLAGDVCATVDALRDQLQAKEAELKEEREISKAAMAATEHERNVVRWLQKDLSKLMAQKDEMRKGYAVLQAENAGLREALRYCIGAMAKHLDDSRHGLNNNESMLMTIEKYKALQSAPAADRYAQMEAVVEAAKEQVKSINKLGLMIVNRKLINALAELEGVKNDG